MCCDCVWYCEGIHLIIYTGNRWQPGNPAGNLATSWQPRLPVRTHGDWQPLLATAGNRWQPLATWQPAGNRATWQPGNLLATYWQPLLATWQPGAQLLKALLQAAASC